MINHLFKRLKEGESMTLQFYEYQGERQLRNKSTDEIFTKYAFRFFDEDGKVITHLATSHEAWLSHNGIVLAKVKPLTWLKVTRKEKYGYEWSEISPYLIPKKQREHLVDAPYYHP